jgi:hypothetical protein
MPIEGRSSKGLIFLILQISKNVVEAMASNEWSSEERTNFEVEITTVVGATSGTSVQRRCKIAPSNRKVGHSIPRAVL